ncbi:MAG: hypothetical protein ACJ05G_12205 [Actinomycetota bacterium]
MTLVFLGGAAILFYICFTQIRGKKKTDAIGDPMGMVSSSRK